MPLLDLTMDREREKTALQLVKDLAPRKENETLQGRLDNNSLDLDSLLESLKGIVDTSDSDAIRLRAIETALKMHDALKEKPVAVPIINITINGAECTRNPILYPRELNVEPIPTSISE